MLDAGKTPFPGIQHPASGIFFCGAAMSLKTRQNPETGALEVLVKDEWVRFEEYRKRQIDDAYQNSIKFLRERLGEDEAKDPIQRSDEINKNQ
jgi:hypothetical protein